MLTKQPKCNYSRWWDTTYNNNFERDLQTYVNIVSLANNTVFFVRQAKKKPTFLTIPKNIKISSRLILVSFEFNIVNNFLVFVRIFRSVFISPLHWRKLTNTLPPEHWARVPATETHPNSSLSHMYADMVHLKNRPRSKKMLKMRILWIF